MLPVAKESVPKPVENEMMELVRQKVRNARSLQAIQPVRCKDDKIE
jgi:hypothetical protein